MSDLKRITRGQFLNNTAETIHSVRRLAIPMHSQNTAVWRAMSIEFPAGPFCRPAEWSVDVAVTLGC